MPTQQHKESSPALCAERPVQGTPPWPDTNNQMLAHLMNEALRTNADDPKGAVVWLAVHCFFEGGIDAVAHADELGLHSTSGSDTTLLTRALGLHPERPGDIQDQSEVGHVAVAALHLGDVAGVHTSRLGQVGLAQAGKLAEVTDPLAEYHELRICLSLLPARPGGPFAGA